MKYFDALSELHKKFCLAYIENGCKSVHAARDSGFAGDYHVLSVTACRLLRRNDIRRALDELREANAMSAVEVLDRHADIARGDMQDVTDEHGRYDHAKAKANRKTHLIKAVTSKTYWDKSLNAEVVEVRAELYPADQAQRTIMKHLGLLADIIAVKKLPEDRDELVDLLKQEIERTTGQKVPSAAELEGKAN